MQYSTIIIFLHTKDSELPDSASPDIVTQLEVTICCLQYGGKTCLPHPSHWELSVRAQLLTHHSNMASQSGQVEVGEAKGLLFLLTSIVLIDDSFDTFYASLYLSDNLIW